MANAAGIANTTHLVNSIAELFDRPFLDMRDEEASFLKMIPRKSWPKATYDLQIRDLFYSPVWSAGEADQTSFISSTTVASDGVGTATAFLAPNNHPFVRSSVSMRYNYGAVEVSGVAQAALNGSPGAYVDVVTDETDQQLRDMWRQQNIRALSTATTSGNSGKDIDGLGVLFNGTSYGGLSVASYPAWGPSIDSSTTTLTVASMQTLYNKVVHGTETLGTDTIRQANISAIWTSPQQFTALGNLSTSLRRYRPTEKLDPGFEDGDLEFNGKPVKQIDRFPSGYMIFYSTGCLWVELQSLKTIDYSPSVVDALLMGVAQYANFALADRKNQGIMTSLT